MSTLMKGEKPLKMFEILPEGIEQLTKSKKSGMSIVKPNDKLVVEFDYGEGILYEIINDMINPLLRQHRLVVLGIARQDCDARAEGRESARDLESESRAAARDDGGLALQAARG